MTWTYGGDPGANDRDWVRFRIGDTDTTDQQMTDEEIAALLAEYTSKQAAAVVAVEALIAKFSRLASKSVGDLSIQYNQRLENYQSLAERLRREQAIRAASPVAGGISVNRKGTVRDNDDRVRPWAARDQFSQVRNSENEGTDGACN